MGSTRLPGKILVDLAGRPMLAQQLSRLRRCRMADDLIVATTSEPADDPVAIFAAAEGVGCFRGSETDVLRRYVGAARQSEADIIVRITADCPLIDPEQVDRVIASLEANAGCDYASNVIKRTYPRGLDAEAFTRQILELMEREAVSPASREHVTHYLLKEHPERFKIRAVVDDQDNSDLRWTVDTPEDLRLIRRLYDELNLGRHFRPYQEILAYARSHPELAKLNAHVEQKKI